MNCNRIACVLIPDFGLNLMLQKDPTLLLEPAVLVDGDRETARLLEVNGKARRAGLRPGLTRAQADSLCDGLNILIRREEPEIAESRRLVKCLQSVAPMVESDRPGMFFLEADGLQLLYGDYPELAEKLIARVKNEQYPVSVGIAANKFTARVAAEVSRRYHYTCIPEGCQREFLANLSITHLQLDEEIETRLLQLGLRTMGQLAAFPSNELQERFGRTGRLLSLLCRGDDPDELLAESLPEEISLTSYPVAPLKQAPAVIGLAERLLERLFIQLQAEEKGCRCLAVRLVFAGKQEKWFLLTLAAATLNVRIFSRQLACKLEKTHLPAAVTEITLTVTATAPLLTKQLKLTGEANGIAGLADVDSSLSRILPQNQLYRPRLSYSLVPETSFELLPLLNRSKKIAVLSGSAASGPHYSLKQISGLRLLTPPQETEITAAGGRPRQLTIERRRKRIKHLVGPWKLSGNWWSRGFSRQYYEVETTTQQRYLLYFDILTSRWYLQGIFD